MGGRGKITPGDPNKLRSCAGTGCSQIGSIPSGDTFDVLGGPSCADGYWWWRVKYNGTTGWTAEGDSSSYWVTSVSPGTSNSGSDSGSNNSNSGSSSNGGGSGNSCPAHVEPFDVGDRGKVTPGDPNVLRSCAGTGCSQIGSIPGNGEFDVLGGPSCANGYWWWRVNYSGTTGWTAEGQGSDYWVMRVGKNSENQSQHNSNNTNLDIYYQPFDHTYHLEVNTQTCVILNGSAVVADELSRFTNWMNSKSAVNRLRAALTYFFENNGQIEGLRHTIEDRVTCQNPSYKVGSREMDMSGLGNLVFGYYSEWYPQELEDLIADVAQARNDESGWQFQDNYDDETQRRTGRALANQYSGSSVSSSQVEQAAKDNYLD